MLHIFVVLLAVPHLTAGLVAAVPHAIDADVGNWTVKNCILAQFAMEIVVDPRNTTDLNDTLTIDVPRDAVVDQDASGCGKDEQTLVLRWSERSINETDLQRRLTIVFAYQNGTKNQVVDSYGVKQIWGTFVLAHFNVTEVEDKKNVTTVVKSMVTVDSGKRSLDKLMFRVPANRSYLCHDIGEAQLFASLNFNFTDSPPSTSLKNATFGATNVAFDAFRPIDAPNKAYQTPMDCDYQPSDIVPIAVGITLAGLVVFVLIAYLIGRRRRRQLGYQSV